MEGQHDTFELAKHIEVIFFFFFVITLEPKVE